MSSLFKARAESAAKVISMQNEINFLKKQLSESDTSSLKAEIQELKLQLNASCVACQEKDAQIADLEDQLASSDQPTTSTKKRGRKSKHTAEQES